MTLCQGPCTLSAQGLGAVQGQAAAAAPLD